MPTTADGDAPPPRADAVDAADAVTGRAEVGVGPWPGGPDAWPDDPRLDPALLAEGDRRNVVDRYRYWTIASTVQYR